ncbi:MAG: Gfo/Idh/MocA family oxidoreductase [Verrucomicrobiota bacterium]
MSTTGLTPAPGTGFFRDRPAVRWGIIGCGDVTELKSGPAFNKATHSRLVAVMRRDAAKAADYARRHQVPRWYDNVDALLRDPEVDAVYIATPPDAHLDCALQVAAAGKPAYLEKPMARNTTECDAILSAFAARQLPLFVAYYRRRLPRFLLVRDALARGTIGTVTGITYCQTAPFHRRDSAWRTDVTRAGAGHLLDLGSHTVDLIDFLFGPLEHVTGSAANLASPYLAEDVAAMAFTAGGIPGTATWNFASDVAGESLRIYGTAGRIDFAVFEPGPVVIETSAGVQRLDCPHPENVQLPLIQSVVDDLRGGAPCPSTGTSARRASAVLDRVLNAYYGGRDDAFWTRPATWPGRRG